MKLNPDCIRNILIAVEDNTNLKNWLAYPDEADLCPSLANYTTDEVKYHINQCILSDLIIGEATDMEFSFIIKDLTPKGHAFLANTRADNTWKSVKDVAKQLGVYSLDVLIKIASEVAASLITGHFKGN